MQFFKVILVIQMKIGRNSRCLFSTDVSITVIKVAKGVMPLF